MTDKTEPAAEGDQAAAAPVAPADNAPARERRSLWGRLNRTNRIAAVVLGGVGAVVSAVLIFGAGLLVGAEFGDSEGHHDEVGTSEYGDGDRAAAEDNGDSGESAGESDGQGGEDRDGERDQGQRGEQGGSDAPGESNGAPRP